MFLIRNCFLSKLSSTSVFVVDIFNRSVSGMVFPSWGYLEDLNDDDVTDRGLGGIQ